jgi:hypothetical protein
VHGGIAEVAQHEGEGIEEDDVDVVVSQFFGGRQGLLQFLLDEDVDFVEVLQEGFIQILLDGFDVVEEGFEEAVESDDAGVDAVDSEVLAGHVEEAGVEVLDFEYSVDLEEGYLDYFLAG